MTWEGEATMTQDEMEAAMKVSAQEYLKLFNDRGIPLETDHLVEQERVEVDGEVVYKFKWMKKGA